MLALEDEAKVAFPRAAVTFHARIRPGQLLPDSIHRVRLCRVAPTVEGRAPVLEKPIKCWYQYLKGRPSRKELYLYVGDVSLLGLYNRFRDRADSLNNAREALVRCRSSIEKRLKARADPRAWEAGDLSIPTPLLESGDLPSTGLRALGAAWRIALRIAAVQYELFALAERYNADPPYKELRLAFREDSEHPLGRFIWTHNGDRLSVIARRLAKGKHPGRVDEASLPDWLMRRLFIPASARKAIRPHELRRRRMARIYGRYLAVLEPLLSAGPKSIKKAHELLGRAGFPESELTESGPDPIPLAM
ncbi:MAG TPA: hypothetical protein VKU80_11055 [Planctomycetota bacterium]|nr:hypothetical protein [Planctomycetota bacterium]